MLCFASAAQHFGEVITMHFSYKIKGGVPHFIFTRSGAKLLFYLKDIYGDIQEDKGMDICGASLNLLDSYVIFLSFSQEHFTSLK